MDDLGRTGMAEYPVWQVSFKRGRTPMIKAARR